MLGFSGSLSRWIISDSLEEKKASTALVLEGYDFSVAVYTLGVITSCPAGGARANSLPNREALYCCQGKAPQHKYSCPSTED